MKVNTNKNYQLLNNYNQIMKFVKIFLFVTILTNQFFLNADLVNAQNTTYSLTTPYLKSQEWTKEGNLNRLSLVLENINVADYKYSLVSSENIFKDFTTNNSNTVYFQNSGLDESLNYTLFIYDKKDKPVINYQVYPDKTSPNTSSNINIELEKYITDAGGAIWPGDHYQLKIKIKNAPLGYTPMIEQYAMKPSADYSTEIPTKMAAEFAEIKQAEYTIPLWIVHKSNTFLDFNFIKSGSFPKIKRINININNLGNALLSGNIGQVASGENITPTPASNSLNANQTNSTGGTSPENNPGQTTTNSTNNNPNTNPGSNSGPALQEMKGPNTISDRGGSTYGKCEGIDGQVRYDNNFSLNLSDEDNNIDQFYIDNNNSTPITAPSFYKNTGSELRLELKFYDPITDQRYNINLGNQNDSDYGLYKAKNSATEQIKVLSGSSLKLAEEDDGIFTGGDDVFTLLFLNKDGKNVMLMKREGDKYPLPQDDCDLDFDIETVKKYIDGQIKLEIPLEKNGEKRTVQAQIKFKNGSMQFISGLESTASELTDGESTDENAENNGAGETNTKKGPRKPIGFTGTNLEIMERDAYKGISNETDIETTVVGLVNWFLGFVASIAVLLFIYGGYMWLTDQGDESNIEKAKTIIAGTLIGILIIISAYTIINTLLDFSNAYPAGCEFGAELETDGTVGMDVDCNISIDTPSIGSGIGGIIGL